MAEPPDIRIGTAEREDAMRRLSDHFAAGRLSVAEFDERSAIVAAAVTRGDLEQVFTDLPAPVSLEKPKPAARGFRLPAGVPERVMPVITILALILFLVTHQWWFFLAIPLVGALLFGDRRGHGRWH
ncbi:DUF1707 domain-containing protein [Nocardia otitidiscaviarum]|uniref:DUF1707 SHOCT-like domain-containing protein n=1 Tax=Nocardia otitidiscaviarum TaxID=1823 RepID=UPI0004A77522|nr:DUF1707 domain-containing protein [Nocardia otitidiscaviarum]MBF6133601.1 DUF1707 domain-containing protein [Nocardia otitidiscaviarum]MBF6487630.1 DUF1707 domain-containing protein [Nocardia otitidiscaviarum]